MPPSAAVALLPCSLFVATIQVQRKYEGAESRASSAAAEVEQLGAKLSNAEDEILALEGQISILEQELAKYAS
jgi:chromosome segregation ATPase